MESDPNTQRESYWIVVDGRNFKTRTPIASKRFGPYASEQEAELAMPDVLPWDTQDHVYQVHVEVEPDIDNPEG